MTHLKLTNKGNFQQKYDQNHLFENVDVTVDCDINQK